MRTPTKAFVALLSTSLLVGCGESSEETYKRGYEDGYQEGFNDGQYELCREIESVAPNLSGRLQGCRGV